jgi:hypothetical protein
VAGAEAHNAKAQGQQDRLEALQYKGRNGSLRELGVLLGRKEGAKRVRERKEVRKEGRKEGRQAGRRKETNGLLLTNPA